MDETLSRAEWVKEALSHYEALYQARAAYVREGKNEDFDAQKVAASAFIQHLWSDQP